MDRVDHLFSMHVNKKWPESPRVARTTMIMQQPWYLARITSELFADSLRCAAAGPPRPGLCKAARWIAHVVHFIAVLTIVATKLHYRSARPKRWHVGR